MGDVADMMIDGTLCEGCGEYMGDEGQGYPRRCSSCKEPTPKGYAMGSKPGNPKQKLGHKQLKRLKMIRDWTDNPPGMYPGYEFDMAPTKHTKLINAGFAEMYHPHNPVHKNRVVISDYGRKYLSEQGEKQ